MRAFYQRKWRLGYKLTTTFLTGPYMGLWIQREPMRTERPSEDNRVGFYVFRTRGACIAHFGKALSQNRFIRLCWYRGWCVSEDNFTRVEWLRFDPPRRRR